jgi:uncharacterized membrane protein SirB2
VAVAAGRSHIIVMLTRIQGTYFLLTGVWPLLHMRSFEAVTGPKRDRWLVKMVGLLAASIGVTLLAGARRRAPSRETRVLAMTSAVSFAAIDVWYALRGRIAPVYLADAVVELGLLGAWLRRGDAAQVQLH